MLSICLLVVFLTSVGFLCWLSELKEQYKGKRIPGPHGLPIFGNLLQAGNRMPYKFSEWAEKYGDIFQIKLGSRKAIVISDPKMLKEIYSDPAFTGRQVFEGFEIFENELLGIIRSEGEFWEHHRKFLVRQLRNFGFGKSSMEQLIIDEVNETIAHFQDLKNKFKSINNVKDVFLIAVINSLFTLLASKRFRHDDKKLLQMLADSNAVDQLFIDRFIYVLMPWTRYFLPKGGFSTVDLIRVRNIQFYSEMVMEHKATFQEGNNRDFIDAYLTEMKVQKDKPESVFFGDRAERQLINILHDMHIAGSDTTSTTLTWTVLYLCKFKHVQQRLQKEISDVTQDCRQVSIADRQNMPYTLALIDEVLRFSSLVPTGVQQRALTGKAFKGHWIPKDTWIFPNLYHIHFNSEIWGDAKEFRPERFLIKTDDGDIKYKKNENLMPFQIGKRQCVGESLARDSLFLFITNVFQKFEISFDPDQPEPGLEPQVSFQMMPQPYSVVLKERVWRG